MAWHLTRCLQHKGSQIDCKWLNFLAYLVEVPKVTGCGMWGQLEGWRQTEATTMLPHPCFHWKADRAQIMEEAWEISGLSDLKHGVSIAANVEVVVLFKESLPLLNSWAYRRWGPLRKTMDDSTLGSVTFPQDVVQDVQALMRFLFPNQFSGSLDTSFTNLQYASLHSFRWSDRSGQKGQGFHKFSSCYSCYSSWCIYCNLLRSWYFLHLWHGGCLCLQHWKFGWILNFQGLQFLPSLSIALCHRHHLQLCSLGRRRCGIWCWKSGALGKWLERLVCRGYVSIACIFFDYVKLVRNKKQHNSVLQISRE